jgi:hypothetical protein
VPLCLRVSKKNYLRKKLKEMPNNSFRIVFMGTPDFAVTILDRLVQNNLSIVGSGAGDVEKKFDDYWLIISKPLFDNENKITKEFIDSIEKTPLKDFLNYTPFEKKERVFTYTTDSDLGTNIIKSQQTLISSLADTTNRNNEINKWNSRDGITEGAYISKVKLN